MAEQSPSAAPIYEIEIEGYLDAKWAAWFDGLTITHRDAGSTTLSGPLPDQTALHSVLNKIRDMNLTLKSVQCMDEMEQAK